MQVFSWWSRKFVTKTASFLLTISLHLSSMTMVHFQIQKNLCFWRAAQCAHREQKGWFCDHLCSEIFSLTFQECFWTLCDRGSQICHPPLTVSVWSIITETCTYCKRMATSASKTDRKNLAISVLGWARRTSRRPSQTRTSLPRYRGARNDHTTLVASL